MATQVGDLAVVLSANIDQFKNALKDAERSTQTFGSNLTKHLGDARGAVTGFIAAYAGIQAVQGILGKLNEVGELTDLAAGLNITTEELQKFQYAGISAGVSTERLTGLFQRVSDASHDFANGNEDIVAAFKKLGISTVDLNNPADTLLKIVERLNSIPNAADKMATAIQIGGKSGAQALLRLANEGTENLQKSMVDLSEKGLLLGNKTADGADAAGDAIAKLAYEFNQTLRKAVTDNKDVIVTLATAVFDFLSRAVDGVVFLTDKFVKLGEAIGVGAAKLMGYETGEDALARVKDRLTEIQKQIESADKVFNNAPNEILRGTAEKRITQLKKEKEELEKALKDLQVFEKKAEQTNKPTVTPPPKPTVLRGAGAGKDKSGKSASYDNDPILSGAASIFGRTATQELETLYKIRDELFKQKEIWETMDQSKMSDEMKDYRLQALKKYSEALTEVDKQEQELYDKQNEALVKNAKAWNDFADSQRAYALQVRSALDPMVAITAEAEKLQAAVAGGYLTNDEMQKYLDLLKAKGTESVDIMKELGMTMQSAFQQAIIDGKGFKDVLAGVIKDIASMILKVGVINPLMNQLFGGKAAGGGAATQGLLSSAWGWVSGLFKSADGSAFDGGVRAFATGGIVDTPTYFKFANGGKLANGLMGEAGPEAIMPLTRINGKLGVRAEGFSGSSPIININTTVNGGNTNDETGQVVNLAVYKALADQRIVAATRPGGILNSMQVR